MNTGKSIKIALAVQEKTSKWLAGEIGISQRHMSNLLSKKDMGMPMIKKISKAFGLQVSEFIALGE